MYDRILVPLALNHGISRNTLQIARALCAPGGSITALHVYEMPEGSVSAYLSEEIVQQGYDRAREVLQEKIAGIEGVKAVLTRGHAYRTIIDYAEKNDIGCIVIGSHKPGLSDYFLGSTAARVVRHAPCAVHVHRDS